MDIQTLRQAPELPDAYFEVLDELQRQQASLPLLTLPGNLAGAQALLAFEQRAFEARALASDHVVLALARGARVPEMAAFTRAIRAHLNGLRLLLRSVDMASVAAKPELPLLPTNPSDNALAALSASNFAIDRFDLLRDVAIGWRGFEVNGNRIRATSRSPLRLARGIELDHRLEAEDNAPYLAASIGAEDEELLNQRLHDTGAALPAGAVYEPSLELTKMALPSAVRAGLLLHPWHLDDEIPVAGRFSVVDYRRTTEIVKAYGRVFQTVNDARWHAS